MAPSPIRIVRVIARMNVGGPAWQVSVLQRRLGAPEFETTLVCGRVSEDEQDFIEVRDADMPHIVVSSFGRSVKVLGDVLTFITLVRLFRRLQPDIVHTHTAKAGVIGRVAALVARVPVRVHTFHGHLLHGYFGPLVTRTVILVEKLLAARTTALVAVGSQVRDELVSAGIGRVGQYSVIAPGVAAPRALSMAEARRELDLAGSARVVLFVGRLTRIKRVDRLLDAFKEVVNQLPDALLVIVGDGDLGDTLKAQAAPMGDRVRFEGWKSDLASYYSAANVAVLSSDNEGLPVTLIEASMAGVPCVTTDVGSAGEVVLDGVSGFVVNREAQAIVEALVKLLGDETTRLRMGIDARKIAEERFGEARLADDYQRLYRGLMGRPEIGLEA